MIGCHEAYSLGVLFSVPVNTSDLIPTLNTGGPVNQIPLYVVRPLNFIFVYTKGGELVTLIKQKVKDVLYAPLAYVGYTSLYIVFFYNSLHS